MAMRTFTMRQLLESGVHYGHNTRRWNPKMAPYIFGERSEVHILDLQQTVPMLQRALEAARDIVKAGGRVLFVGTKVQGSAIVKEAAKRCGQYYINHRWLGGLLTNWKTVNQSIKRLKEMQEELANPGRMTKKEILKLQREHDKLELAIGGIAYMGGLPDMLFVLDTNKEAIAVLEAQRLNLPIIAIIDSNSTPDLITYPVPGNDDATRAIRLYCDLMADSILDGLQQSMVAAGIDIGASANLPVEEIMEEAVAVQEAADEAPVA